jgi:hypothetical protein
MLELLEIDTAKFITPSAECISRVHRRKERMEQAQLKQE